MKVNAAPRPPGFRHALVHADDPVELLATHHAEHDVGQVPRGAADLGRLDLALGDREAGVRGEQVLHHLAVTVAPLRLEVRTLVPVQAQPAQCIQQRQIAVLAVALGIGVFDAEHEFAAGVSGVRPVEQCGADQPDVGRAGR